MYQKIGSWGSFIAWIEFLLNNQELYVITLEKLLLSFRTRSEQGDLISAHFFICIYKCYSSTLKTNPK